jgi:2-polyprenyl-3-methyl-5-hydroxy-6-metoxy-1,4-benzoquinol methylase
MHDNKDLIMKWLDYYLQKRRFRAAGKHIRPGIRLLDIGCYQGEFFHYLKDKAITGTGIDSNVESLTPQLPAGVVLIRDHFPSEKLAEQKFDYITALAVFEHIPDEYQPSFLGSCAGLLSDKGKIIITVPSPLVDHIINFLKFLKIVDAMSIEEHHGFSPKQVIPLFEKAGFKLLFHKKFELGLNNLFVFEKKEMQNK